MIPTGQFGLVYKGDWFIDVAGKPTTVAVKTLKGMQKALIYIYVYILSMRRPNDVTSFIHRVVRY